MKKTWAALALAVGCITPVLAQRPPGDAAPVSIKTLSKSGKVGTISYSYEIQYPQFTGTAAGFAELNARFAEKAKQAAQLAVPAKPEDFRGEQEWFSNQEAKVSRPSKRAVLVTLDYSSFAGGAHPSGGTDCILVDLGSGKQAGPQDVFLPGDRWLDTLLPLVRADLKKQFTDKPGFKEALETPALTKTLRKSSFYCWKADKLVLTFNAYVVGPYVSGPFEVEIPRSSLKGLLKPDGPLGN